MPKLKVASAPKINAKTVLVLAVENDGKKVKPSRTEFSSAVLNASAFDTDFAPIGASADLESLTKVQLTSTDDGQVFPQFTAPPRIFSPRM